MSDKRVACLYRLSTKMQVEKDEEFTLQRSACHSFVAAQQGWGIVFEYREPAVSAFNSTLADRPVLSQLLRDAMDRKFDILLVFMLDRLCRSPQDGRFIYTLLGMNGITLCSVTEGRVDCIEMIDRYAALAAAESTRTSQRVIESHKQMVQRGHYRGGTSPYGYRLTKVNRNGQEVLDIEIDPVASTVVRQIFHLAHHEGWGGNRIARHLNSQGVPSPAGKAWHNGAMNYILINPIYKGLMAMGKTRAVGRMTSRTSPDEWILAEEPREDLVIIPATEFDELQRQRQARRMCFQPIDRESHGKNSPLLLVGGIRCGHCGYTLSTTYTSRYSSEKTSQGQRKRKAFYRCSGKGLAKVECAGQTTYAKHTIESVVLDKVSAYLDSFARLDIASYVSELTEKLQKNEGKEAAKLERELEDAYQRLLFLRSASTGAATGTARMGSRTSNISDTDHAISELNSRLQLQREAVERKNAYIQRLINLQRLALTWQDAFDRADLATKKSLLRDVIESVTVWRGRIEVKFSYDLDDLGLSRSQSLGDIQAPPTTSTLARTQ